MKRVFAFALAPLLLVVWVSLATQSEEKSKINGAWKLAQGKYNEKEELTDTPGNILYYKIFDEGNFVVVHIDKDAKQVSNTHGGTYTIEDNQLTETVEYGSEATKELLGNKFEFDVEIKENEVVQKGKTGTRFEHLEEHWARIE